jgi:hypothetical protein
MSSVFLPRIGEIRQVTALLDTEHDDVESLSRSVLVSAADIVFARETYVVVQQCSLGLFTWGPYWTVKQAENALSSNIPEPGPDRSRILITKLIGVQDD